MVLPHTNKTISIRRLVTSGALKNWTEVATGVDVYINYTREELVDGFDNQPAFSAFRMMTSGDHTEIVIGDVVDDGTKKYQIRTPAAVSDDMTGVHHQYLMTVYAE